MGVKEPEGLTLACKLPFHKMTTMTQAKCTFLTCTLYLYNKNLHNTKVTEIERITAQSMLDYNLKRTFPK